MAYQHIKHLPMARVRIRHVPHLPKHPHVKPHDTHHGTFVLPPISNEPVKGRQQSSTPRSTGSKAAHQAAQAAKQHTALPHCTHNTILLLNLLLSHSCDTQNLVFEKIDAPKDRGARWRCWGVGVPGCCGAHRMLRSTCPRHTCQPLPLYTNYHFTPHPQLQGLSTRKLSYTMMGKRAVRTSECVKTLACAATH